MDATTLNDLCAQYSGLNLLRTQLTALRTALRAKNYNPTTIESIAQCLLDFQFSIDEAVDGSTLNTTSKNALKTILLRKIQHTISAWNESMVVTGNRFQNDSDILFIPNGVVFSGSCINAFNRCTSLIYIGNIDTSGCTSFLNCFRDTPHLLNSELTIDCSSVTSLYALMAKPTTVHLTGINSGTARLTTMGETFYRCTKTTTVTGLDLSYVNISQNTSFNTTYASNGSSITQTNLSFAEGSKIQHVDALFGSSQVYQVYDNLTNLTPTTMWHILRHSYDYNDADNQTDAQGRALVLTKNTNMHYQWFRHATARTNLESYIDNNNDGALDELLAFLTTKGIDYSTLSTAEALLSAYMTAKGWTY